MDLMREHSKCSEEAQQRQAVGVECNIVDVGVVAASLQERAHVGPHRSAVKVRQEFEADRDFDTVQDTLKGIQKYYSARGNIES